MSRPKLPALKVGDTVYVMRSGNDMRGRTPQDRAIEARVVKVARVWITVESVSKYSHEYRFRLDDQCDGSDHPGSSERFVTPEQLTWEASLREARDYLRDSRIAVEYGSPWRDREIELAAALRAAIDA